MLTKQHVAHALSQRKKTLALLGNGRHRGIFKLGWILTFADTGYNLVRMRNLRFKRRKLKAQRVLAGPTMNPRDTNGCGQDRSRITES
jgi:hypothetical protein